MVWGVVGGGGLKDIPVSGRLHLEIRIFGRSGAPTSPTSVEAGGEEGIWQFYWELRLETNPEVNQYRKIDAPMVLKS